MDSVLKGIEGFCVWCRKVDLRMKCWVFAAAVLAACCMTIVAAEPDSFAEGKGMGICTVM